MRPVVGVVAKAPVAGAVKTRLCPPLVPIQAATVARALVADTVALARHSGMPTWCVYAGALEVMRTAVPDGLPCLAQVGTSFAKRLANAQADLFRAGHDRVVLLGADCPTVQPEDLAATFAGLEDHDVVLGPAMDGGYTLLAARRPVPELFLEVPMGTADVLEATVARACAAGLAVRLLDPRHDLDTAQDFLAAAAAGQLTGAPRTRALLPWFT